jgi:uncharacterized membrane protein
MPYCVQCGTAVGATDQFCGKCGKRQTGPAGTSSGPGPGSRPAGDFMVGVSNRNASLLCYIPMVGWIAAIVVLASERYRREMQVRFNAFQGLYLFVAWLIVDWGIRPVLDFSDYDGGFRLHNLVTHSLQLLIFAAWVIMIIKVSHDENYKLPIVGELAERSVSEQRS